MSLNCIPILKGSTFLPEDGDVFIYKEPRVFDQCDASVVFLKVSTCCLTTLAEGYFVPQDFIDEYHAVKSWKLEAVWRDVAKQYAKPSVKLTEYKLEVLWTSLGSWDAEGIIARFNPLLTWAEEGPITDLKSANEAPGRTECVVCKAKLKTWKLKTWNSDWSIGKYCPNCEK